MKTKLASLALSLFLASQAFAKDSDIEIRGELKNLTSSSVTVSSLTCNVTSNTEFKESDDTIITAADFTIGESVKLKCRGSDAKSLEKLAGDDNNGGNGGGGSDGKPNNNNKSKEIEFENRASKIPGVNTSASGSTAYSYKRDKKGRTDVRLTAKVKVPLQSASQPIIDTSSAPSLNLTFTISRAGTDYATCSLQYDGLRPTVGARKHAEYKLDIREKRGTLDNKKGICDTNLETADTQAGIPGVKKGDSFILSETSAGELLKGKFN